VSRALSRREKVLVVIFALLLVTLVYYLLVYQPVQEACASLELNRLDTEISIQVEQAKSIQMEKMREELEALRKNDGIEVAPMARFDNAQNVMAELSVILSAATGYDISFSPLADSGNLLRRTIGMSFGCSSYEDARAILQQLYACRYRCQINDVSLTAQAPPASDALRVSDLTLDKVQVSLTVTFYEIRSASSDATAAQAGR